MTNDKKKSVLNAFDEACSKFHDTFVKHGLRGLLGFKNSSPPEIPSITEELDRVA